MNTEKFREVIQERNRIAVECNDEWSTGIEKCWMQEIEMLGEDVAATISFLLEECTAEEFSWISEIIDDLVEKTQSREIVQAYKSLMSKYPEECKKYNITGSIKLAENTLSAEVNNG